MFDERRGAQPLARAAAGGRSTRKPSGSDLRRVIGRCTWQTYDAAFAGALREAKADGVTHVIFGDILFDEHRAWADGQCAAQDSPRSSRCSARPR